MAFEQFQTQVLLLHSEQSTLDVLSSGFDDRYTVHCATSGIEALNTLGETPIDVIVSAHDLPGMSGLDALREAKKRSPDTIAILMTAADASDGLEALVSDKEVYQIIRGDIAPAALFELVETATKSARLVALSESANDTSAAVDSGPDLALEEEAASRDEIEETGEHIVMETAENGSCVITDATGRLPTLKAEKIVPTPGVGTRQVDILALTQDEQFLATIREATVGTHKVHHAAKPGQAEDFVRNFPVGVLVTDAGLAGDQVEAITRRIRGFEQRLVAIVAGRRDDGEMLMDLINRGQVYRFLLKPVSPGRARLAIEASVRHHVEAPEQAFQGRPTQTQSNAPAAANAAAKHPAADGTPSKPEPRAKKAGVAATRSASQAPGDDRPRVDGLDEAFDDGPSFTETMTGIAASFGRSLGKAVGGRRTRGESSGQNSEMGKLPPQTASKRPADDSGPKREPTLTPTDSPQTSELPAARIAGGKPSTPAEKAAARPASKPATEDKPVTPAARRAGQEDDTVPGAAARYRADRGRQRTGLPRYVVPGIAGAAVLGIAVAAFMLVGGDDPGASATRAPATRPPPVAPVADEPGAASTEPPSIASSEADGSPALVDTAIDTPGATPEATSPEAAQLLQRARTARADGDVFAPAGQNAVELYLAAQAIDADNAEISAELQNVIVEVYGLAETALLENRTRDASRALRVLGLADTGSQRLTFLTAQLNQQQLRVAVDDARGAIRESRFEDAGRLLARAETIAGGSTDAIDALSAELADARSAQQLGDVLALASERLAGNQLIEPANDNARYYFDIAANIDPSNTAAQQGLLAVASKLVLRARTAIDDREFDAAESLLADAAALDPASSELSAAAAALQAARDAAVSEALSYDDASPAPGAQREETTSRTAEAAAPGDDSASTGTVAAATAEATADESAADEPAASRSGAPSSGGGSGAEAAGGATAAGEGTLANAPPDASAVPVAEAAANAAGAAVTGSGELQDLRAAGETPAPEATTQKVELVSITELERIHYVPPKYPRAAQRRELSGYVDVIFTVTGAGGVADIEIRESEPGDAFVNAAIDAVQEWKFEPVIEDGIAVPKRVAVRLSFNFQ